MTLVLEIFALTFGCWCCQFAARNCFSTFHEDHEMLHTRDLQKLGVLTPERLKVYPSPLYCLGGVIMFVINMDIFAYYLLPKYGFWMQEMEFAHTLTQQSGHQNLAGVLCPVACTFVFTA